MKEMYVEIYVLTFFLLLIHTLYGTVINEHKNEQTKKPEKGRCFSFGNRRHPFFAPMVLQDNSTIVSYVVSK